MHFLLSAPPPFRMNPVPLDRTIPQRVLLQWKRGLPFNALVLACYFCISLALLVRQTFDFPA
jgi:hypothetical protein